MVVKIRTDISVEFDDEKILDWAYSPGTRICVIRMCDGSVVTVELSKYVLIDAK